MLPCGGSIRDRPVEGAGSVQLPQEGEISHCVRIGWCRRWVKRDLRRGAGTLRASGGSDANGVTPLRVQVRLREPCRREQEGCSSSLPLYLPLFPSPDLAFSVRPEQIALTCRCQMPVYSRRREAADSAACPGISALMQQRPVPEC